MPWIWPIGLQSIELLGAFLFLFVFTLLMFFRANTSFSFFTDEVHVGLDHADFPRLRNAITEIAFISLRLFLLSLVVQSLEDVVSFSLSLFSRSIY